MPALPPILIRNLLALGAVSLAVLCAQGLAAEPPLSGTRLLQKGATRAWVMDPADPQRYNRGLRFSPLAAVLQVEHQGSSYLYAPAEHDPLHDHAGLAAEFDLCVPGGPASDLPPGYANAKVGEGFLKVGVGVLRRDAKTYNLFQQPEVLALAETRVEWQEDRAEFQQLCQDLGARGYGYELTAAVTVQEGRVSVEWSLRNIGAQPFTTRHYSHNFTRFGNLDSVIGYELEFPYAIHPSGLEAGQEWSGKLIRFTGPIPTWINALIPYASGYEGENSVILRHRGARQQVVFHTSQQGPHTAIHARTNYIAPEQFIELHLPPGETRQWTRTYEFSTL